jgi:hypothetical protein
MMKYPEWKEGSDKAKASHLLFDIGYAYGLLQGVQELLEKLLERREVVMPPSVRLETEEILEAVRSFKLGRLGLVKDIYAAAPEVVERLSRPWPAHTLDRLAGQMLDWVDENIGGLTEKEADGLRQEFKRLYAIGHDNKPG